MIKEIFAQESSRITNPALKPVMQRITGAFFLGNFISALVGLFLIIGSLVAFFFLLWGGLQWILSFHVD